MEINKVVTHKLNLIEREKLELCGVDEVLSSTDKEVYLKLEKDFLVISGENLKIVKLVPEDKSFELLGVIKGINYISKFTKKSLFGKVFK